MTDAAAPSPTPPAAIELWNARFVALLASIAAMFLGVALLLPVAPLLIERGSGSSGQAGLATTLFFGATVLAQLATPRLLERFEPWGLALLGLVLLGGFALVAAAVGGWQAVSATMVPRGVGFGLVTVVVFLIVPHVSPEARRAEALGLCGLAIGVPNVFGPSLGLWWYHQFGEASVLAAAGVVSLLGIVPLLALPRRLPRTPRRATLLREAGDRALLVPFAALTVVTVAFGAVITFVPVILPESGAGSAAAFLLCSGTAGFVARWASGRAADSIGTGRVLTPGFVVLFAGLVVLAASEAAPAVIAAGLLFGAGFGAVQTGLQASIFAAAGPSRISVASVLWNIGLDAGVGLGALALGVFASAAGYGAMLWALPVVTAAAFGVTALGAERSARRP